MTADPASTGSIQLRSTTIGSAPPVYTATLNSVQLYTASAIYQATPNSVEDPTYLASAGIQVGPGTDLVYKQSGGQPFSTYTYPTTLYYGLKGDLSTGRNGFLWPGTQAVSATTFPDQSGSYGDLHLIVTNIGGTGGNSDRITVASTAGIIVNMPVVFSENKGNIVAGTIYFVQSVPTSTTFKISDTRYGGVFTTTNVGAVNIVAVVTTSYSVQVSSTNTSDELTVSDTSSSGIGTGMPIVFSDWFSTVAEGVPYYIGSISSTIIKLAPDATLGSIFQTGDFTARPNTSGLVHTGTTIATATDASGNITVDNSGGFVAGMPITFAASFGGLTGGTLYYIFAAPDSTTVRVTETYRGTLKSTTTSTGQNVRVNVFNSTSVPAYYRVQQPMILSGMNVAMSRPARATGGNDTVIVYIFRTPAGSNQFTGLTPITAFTTTFDDAVSISKSYYNSSKTFGAGDKLHAYLQFTSTTTAHDLTVQLDLF